MDAVLWKQHFRIHPDLQIVTPEPAHILNDNALDLARLDVGKHPLESGPVEVGSRISVVLVVMADSCIAVIPAILFQNSLLVADTVALAVQLIFLGKTLITGGNALGFFLRLAVDIELQHRVLDSRLGFLAQWRVIGHTLKGSDWLLVHLIVKVQSRIVIPCRTMVPCNHHFRLFTHIGLLFRSRKTRLDTSIL